MISYNTEVVEVTALKEHTFNRLMSTVFMKMQHACSNVINEAFFFCPEMLSPSSHVQKDNSEEDSSGSDAGLEPETDRFGFIVTDRSTAG